MVSRQPRQRPSNWLPPHSGAWLLLLVFSLLMIGCQGGDEPDPEAASTPPAASPSPDPSSSSGDEIIVGGGCGDPATSIYRVQGDADTSPLLDQQVTVEAVVTGNMQAGMAGIFIEDADRPDASYSKGLFIFLGEERHEVNAGDTVRVTGKVAEFGQEPHTSTQLSGISELVGCSVGSIPAPTELGGDLDPATREAHENMLVTLYGDWRITGNNDMARFGSLALVAGERLIMPTQQYGAGDQAAQQLRADTQSVIHLDDASNAGYPKTLPYAMALDQPVRIGDQVLNATGVLDHRFGAWRLQPVGPISIEPRNRRPATAPNLQGDLVLASFNLGNYFNGAGGRFTQNRGPANSIEFERQRSKLGAALLGMRADVIAVMEVENDGYGSESAIASLTQAVNDRALQAQGEDNEAFVEPFAFVNAGVAKLGWDVITVGLLYRQDRVQPVGNPATLNSAAFTRRNRPPLAQTFEVLDGGARFTVVAVHLKSKGGCDDASGADADRGDGQGCWSATRTQATQELAQWALNQPTSEDNGEVILLGDFNAYPREAALLAMEEAGLYGIKLGPKPYTINWRAHSGQLDHAFATSSFMNRVRSSGIWHINADESPLLDWSLRHRSRQQAARYYSDGPIRSSDHDPILIGISSETTP